MNKEIAVNSKNRRVLNAIRSNVAEGKAMAIKISESPLSPLLILVGTLAALDATKNSVENFSEGKITPGIGWALLGTAEAGSSIALLIPQIRRRRVNSSKQKK